MFNVSVSGVSVKGDLLGVLILFSFPSLCYLGLVHANGLGG